MTLSYEWNFLFFANWGNYKLGKIYLIHMEIIQIRYVFDSTYWEHSAMPLEREYVNE